MELSPFFFFLFSYVFIVERIAGSIIKLWLYGYQPRSEMAFRLVGLFENEKFQAV